MEKELISYIAGQAEKNIQFLNIIENLTGKLNELNGLLKSFARTENDIEDLKKVLTDDSEGIRVMVRKISEYCEEITSCMKEMKKCSDNNFLQVKGDIAGNTVKMEELKNVHKSEEEEEGYKKLLFTVIKALALFMSGIGAGLLVLLQYLPR